MYSTPFPRLQVRVVSVMTWLIEDLQGLMSVKTLHSQWLFALAASLEKPIHCDTGAALRYGIVYGNVLILAVSSLRRISMMTPLVDKVSSLLFIHIIQIHIISPADLCFASVVNSEAPYRVVMTLYSLS